VEAPGAIVAGQVFNVGGEHLKEKDVVVAAARVAGVKGKGRTNILNKVQERSSSNHQRTLCPKL